MSFPTSAERVIASTVRRQAVPVYQSAVALNNAQIKALPTTGVEIVPAPGANLVLIPLFAALRLTWAANYSNIDANAALFLNIGDGYALYLDQTIGSGISGLLAPGQNVLAHMPLYAQSDGSQIYGYSQGLFDSALVNRSIVAIVEQFE